MLKKLMYDVMMNRFTCSTNCHVLKYQMEDVEVEKLSCLYKPKLPSFSYLNRFICALQTTAVDGLILMSLGKRAGLNMHGLHFV